MLLNEVASNQDFSKLRELDKGKTKQRRIRYAC